MRIQRRTLWAPTLASDSHSLSTEPRPFERVQTPSDIATRLQRQTYSPARIHTGLLFGFTEEQVMTVVLVSSHGVADWYGENRKPTLEIDSRFTLGWSEALLSVLGDRVDWIGTWTAHPDQQLRSEARDLRRFGAGFDTGLFDDRHILMLVGWDDGAFDLRCYRRGLGGRPERVQSEISRANSVAILQDWWSR